MSDIPAVLRRVPKKPTPNEIVLYYEEAVRAGIDATLLIATILNDVNLLVEIIQGHRDRTKSGAGDVVTRVT